MAFLVVYNSSWDSTEKKNNNLKPIKQAAIIAQQLISTLT